MLGSSVLQSHQQMKWSIGATTAGPGSRGVGSRNYKTIHKYNKHLMVQISGSVYNFGNHSHFSFQLKNKNARDTSQSCNQNVDAKWECGSV